MSGLFFKYRREGCRLPSPGGPLLAGERVTCPVHRGSLARNTQPFPKRQTAPSEGSGRVCDNHHRLPPQQPRFAWKHLLAGRSFCLLLFCSFWWWDAAPPQAEVPPGVQALRGETLLLLSVILAESTAQLFSLFFFLLFFIF